MKKQLLLLGLFITALSLTLNAQNISFSFSANHKCDYVALDSIFIQNLTQGGDTTLYWNDTVLTFIFTSINEINAIETDFYVSQNYPNPFETKTDIDVFVPEKDEFSIFVYDLAGREVASYKNILDYGMHNFTFYAGNSKSYILTVQSGKNVQHIQMINFGQASYSNPQIVYNEINLKKEPVLKTKSIKAYFPYEIGDELRFVCFVPNGYLEIIDIPTDSEDYFFDIANNPPDQPLAATNIVTDSEIEWHWNTVEGADGYKYHTSNDYSTAIDNGTNLSFTQDGLDICTEYNLYVWAYNNCGESEVLILTEVTTGPVPDIPTSATHLASDNEIVWNWTEVTGAGGYKWNTENDYSTATDIEGSTSYTQGGLECETEYTLYVWAYNECGASSVLVLEKSTDECTEWNCGDDITFAYNGELVTYRTLLIDYGGEIGEICWMDRNLGAVSYDGEEQGNTYEPSSNTDYTFYGDLFQWGRAADGHQLITWTNSTTGTPVHASQSGPSESASPGNKWLYGSENWYDGENPDPDDLWQEDGTGVNNPCPSGWRVPTEAEWDAERESWNTQNAVGAFGSPLKLTVAGNRIWGVEGCENFNSVGTVGLYWSSSVDGTSSKRLMAAPGGASWFSHNRAGGMSIRCIKD